MKTDSLPNLNNAEKRGVSEQPRANGGYRLISRDVIGALVLIVFVFAVGVGFFAYNYVTKDSDRLQFWVGVMFSFIALVVVICQSLIYVQQAEFMRQQVELANRLAETAIKQFEITDRPWMSFRPELTEPLTFTEQDVVVALRCTAKNIGRSVAINTTINMNLIVPINGGYDDMVHQVIEEQQRVCGNISEQFMTHAIFPLDTFTSEVRFIVSRDELERGRFKDSTWIAIFLVGCVDYQFVGHKRHHQTRFIYELERQHPQYPGTNRGLAIDEDVEMDRLSLRKRFVGSDYAD